MPKPLVKVVIPLHDTAPFVGEALASDHGHDHPGPDACADQALAPKRVLDRRRQRT
jgi:hypothetical protein